LYVVAIADLDRPVDDEVPVLSQVLGVTPYDLRLALKGVLPAIVLRTPSRGVAEEALSHLRARRCTALMMDLDEVVPTGRMVAVRRFLLDDDGLRAAENGPKLAWADVAAIIRVATTTAVERTSTERDVRNTARGMPVTVQEERTRLEREHDQLLYLFPRPPLLPWVLRARDARYLALGPALRPTAHENFVETIAVFRARAPQAVYDERFVAHPLTRHLKVQVRGDVRDKEAVSDAGLDLPVHLLARWIVTPTMGPYRDARE
jgi:hypothetical protein